MRLRVSNRSASRVVATFVWQVLVKPLFRRVCHSFSWASVAHSKTKAQSVHCRLIRIVRQATSMTKSAASRVLAKRSFAVKTAERQFLRALAQTTPSDEGKARARELVEMNKRARSASFLEKYRQAA